MNTMFSIARWGAAIILGILVVFVVLGATLHACSQPGLKRECRDRGGRVVDHHDGRAGWHCDEPDRAEAP